MNMKSIEDVFIHLLSDTYSAEKQLTRGLAKRQSGVKRTA
jgi:ferritin-like metal-binding protein YciE